MTRLQESGGAELWNTCVACGAVLCGHVSSVGPLFSWDHQAWRSKPQEIPSWTPLDSVCSNCFKLKLGDFLLDKSKINNNVT